MTHTRDVLEEVFGEDVHLDRVRSLANGVTEVLNATMVSVSAIGRAYAEAAHIGPKSGVKQVDRLLSNDGIDLDEVGAAWVRHVVGTIPEVVLVMDWTDFDDDDHTTLSVALATTHGRATPLAWKTVAKSKLKNRRTKHELAMVKRLHAWLPEGVRVELLADRAFGYQQMYALLDTLGWKYTIRFRENIVLYDGPGPALRAAAYVPANGRASVLR